MDNPLAYVLARFPERWGRIRELGCGDEEFASLCRDYADAVESHRDWRARSEPEAQRRAQDYAAVVAELEADILREITARDHARS